MVFWQTTVLQEEECVPVTEGRSVFRNINSATVYRTARAERTRIRKSVVNFYTRYYRRHSVDIYLFVSLSVCLLVTRITERLLVHFHVIWKICYEI